jgi:hypothetical protein
MFHDPQTAILIRSVFSKQTIAELMLWILGIDIICYLIR